MSGASKITKSAIGRPNQQSVVRINNRSSESTNGRPNQRLVIRIGPAWLDEVQFVLKVAHRFRGIEIKHNSAVARPFSVDVMENGRGRT